MLRRSSQCEGRAGTAPGPKCPRSTRVGQTTVPSRSPISAAISIARPPKRATRSAAHRSGRSAGVVDPELVAHMGREGVGLGELDRHLAGERSVEASLLVDLGELLEFDVRGLLELLRL